MSLVRIATGEDVEELVRLRGVLFSELALGGGTAEDWAERCAAVLAEWLPRDDMRIVVIDAPDGLASCGVGVVDQRLPAPYNPGGRVGHIFGVVTDPAYRNRGYGRAVMADLLRWFDGRGLVRVDLNASPDGQGLYRSLGFGAHPDPLLSRRR
jgi:ribosomal protein S18 acetylase RimI-like enzyme